MLYNVHEDSPHRSSSADDTKGGGHHHHLAINPTEKKMERSGSSGSFGLPGGGWPTANGEAPPSHQRPNVNDHDQRQGNDIWRVRDSEEEAASASPIRMTPTDDSGDTDTEETTGGQQRGRARDTHLIGSPNTVSTAPSTADEASMIDDGSVGIIGSPALRQPELRAERAMSSSSSETIRTGSYAGGGGLGSGITGGGRLPGEAKAFQPSQEKTSSAGLVAPSVITTDPQVSSLWRAGADEGTTPSSTSVGGSDQHWTMPTQRQQSEQQRHLKLPSPSSQRQRQQMHRRTKSWEERPDHEARSSAVRSYHRSASASATPERPRPVEARRTLAGAGPMSPHQAHAFTPSAGNFQQAWPTKRQPTIPQLQSVYHGAGTRSAEEDGTSPLSSPSLSPRVTPLTTPLPSPRLDGGRRGAGGSPGAPNLQAPRFAGLRPESGVDYVPQEFGPSYRGYHAEMHAGGTPHHPRQYQQPQSRFVPPHALSTPHHHPQQQVQSYRPAPYTPHGHSQHHVPYAPPQGPSLAPSSHGRHAQGQRQPSHRQPPASSSAGGPTSTPSRSSAEILKTLLRKKACLYEPDTSQAVALVTWLVGRQLALAHGYFSRQQLQSGVHACVASKIDSGIITRTKVNRCMQIILNSCFHYIIPRPDGSEERGDAFRALFASRAADDSDLLRTLLLAPWDDLVVDSDSVLSAAAEKSDDEEDPPRRGRRNSNSPAPDSPSQQGGSVGRRGSGERKGDSTPGFGPKRAVLLCFNENVRSAEDVFRCHNEFIRDAANAANLQLSSQDWRAFFGEDTNPPERGTAPLSLPGTIGHIATAARDTDAFGQMSGGELAKFRTSWCAKRYDHDPSLCAFAHVDVNGGWLRRNPSLHDYSDKFCPRVSTVGAQSGDVYVVNACPDGVNCPYAHSKEEVDYHLARYKKSVCAARGGGSFSRCYLGDVCPRSHPTDTTRHGRQQFVEGQQSKTLHQARQQRHYPRDSLGGTAGTYPTTTHHSRGGTPAGATKGSASSGEMPAGAPMLYVEPAPQSEFDKYIVLPGLRDLFRRHSSVLHASSRGGTRSDCRYSYFGDDWGLCAT